MSFPPFFLLSPAKAAILTSTFIHSTLTHAILVFLTPLCMAVVTFRSTLLNAFFFSSFFLPFLANVGGGGERF